MEETNCQPQPTDNNDTKHEARESSISIDIDRYDSYGIEYYRLHAELRDLIRRSEASSDIDTIHQLNEEINEKEARMKNLALEMNIIEKKYHELFQRYKDKIMSEDEFDPIEEHFIEDEVDEFYISSLEAKYQDNMFDKHCDLQYWKMKAPVERYILPGICISLNVLKHYMITVSDPDIDIIRNRLTLIPHRDTFLIDTYIKNKLEFEIPDDLYPRSISQEQFDKWFEDESSNKKTYFQIYPKPDYTYLRNKLRELIK